MTLRTKLSIAAALTLAAFAPAVLQQVAATKTNRPGARGPAPYVLYAATPDASDAFAAGTIAASPSPGDKRVYALRRDTKWIKLPAERGKPGREMPSFLSDPGGSRSGRRGKSLCSAAPSLKFSTPKGR